MAYLSSMFVVLISALMASSALAQSCESSTEAHAQRIRGTNQQGELSETVFPEVAGNASFYQQLDGGWVFALIKAENGWSIRLYESEPVGDAVDLSMMTPPRMGPNPRDIFGWHFRNQANTGSNTGGVNAPQHLRAFVVSPSLAGTGGYRATTDDFPIQPNPDDGIGWLRILDFGLAGLEPGQKARMNYLKFDACVTRKRGDDEQSKMLDAVSLKYTDGDAETFGSCGLKTPHSALHARFLPRVLGGDIDGDGAIDEIAQVADNASEQFGLALCRAGTWLTVIRMDAPELKNLPHGYLGQTEAWHWLSSAQDQTTQWQGAALPAADGDILILERIEKEAVAIYWRKGALRSEHLYHHVEP